MAAKRSSVKKQDIIPDAKENKRHDTPPRISTWIIIIISFAIGGVILFLSVYTAEPEEYTINTFTFTPVPCPGQDTCWKTNVVSNIGVHPITFYTSPTDAKKYFVQQKAVDTVLNMRSVKGGNIIIAIDEGVPGEVGVAGAQIARVTGEQLYKIPTKSALYIKDVTCEQATPQTTIVYLTQGPAQVVVQKPGCVVVSAPTTTELLSISEAYTMWLLGILPEKEVMPVTPDNS